MFKQKELALTAISTITRLVVIFIIYIQENSDALFFQISAISVIGLFRLGFFTYLIEKKNQEENNQWWDKLRNNLLLDLTLLSPIIGILLYSQSSLYLVIVIVGLCRLIQEYSNVYFTLTGNSLWYKGFQVSMDLISISAILLIPFLTLDIQYITFFILALLPLIFYKTLIQRLKKTRYLIIDLISSATHNYDLVLIGLFTIKPGLLSDYALITRIFNMGNRIGIQLTDPYRIKSTDYDSFNYWNRIVLNANLAINTLILVAASIVFSFSIYATVLSLFELILITMFFNGQVISRFLKNNLVRAGLILHTLKINIFGGLIFALFYAFSFWMNSFSLFLTTKITLSLIYIIGYDYLLRYRSGA